jgi:hypothetical protein
LNQRSATDHRVGDARATHFVEALDLLLQLGGEPLVVVVYESDEIC